jgi:hypothetical protein
VETRFQISLLFLSKTLGPFLKKIKCQLTIHGILESFNPFIPLEKEIKELVHSSMDDKSRRALKI